MENITKNGCQTLITGYTKLMIAPAEEIESVDLVNINTKKVTFKFNGSFAEISAENIQFGNQPGDGVYESVIQCEIRGADPELTTKFDAMTKHRYIVCIYDRNKTWWIQGDHNEPMRFEYSQITEPKPPGFSGYKLKFIRKTTLPLCRLQYMKVQPI